MKGPAMSNCPISLSLCVVFLATILTQSASSQTFTVLHTFSGGADGAYPLAGVTSDFAGNLYGTADSGGAGWGTVFELKHSGSGWVLSTLYTFQGGSDGYGPLTRVVFGPDDILYGATNHGGQSDRGTVYSLRAPAHVCEAVRCPWTHTVLYAFSSGIDGAEPTYGDLLFDSLGRIYGTTTGGGEGNLGTAYQLTYSSGNWTESTLYSFEESGANFPSAGVISDSAGNLYGMADEGGSDGLGAVYELARSGSNWIYTDLHDFTGTDGAHPGTGLIFDTAGNLYGTTSVGGSGGGGTVFELSPNSGGWTINVLENLSESSQGPLGGSLTMDAAGNLYGTSFTGGTYDYGYVFKLTYSGGAWNYSTLYDFTGGADGGNPSGTLSST